MERFVSPDKRKCVSLEYDGEARFGPAFFRGEGSGFTWPLANATLGEDVHWSSDSRYVVLLRFMSRDTAKPPDVELLAIDTDDGSVITIDKNQDGLIRQLGFVSPQQYEYELWQRSLAITKQWTTPSASA